MRGLLRIRRAVLFGQLPQRGDDEDEERRLVLAASGDYGRSSGAGPRLGFAKKRRPLERLGVLVR